MDPIDPIPISGAGSPAPPVQRLPPISRERDRPSRSRPETKRRKRAGAEEEPDGREPGEDGRPRIDVRA